MKPLLYCCGFNGFEQLQQTDDTLLEEFTLLLIDNAKDVVFSWCNIFVRTDEEVFACGHIEEESKGTRLITIEDDGIGDHKLNTTIKQMSCSFFRKQALFVTAAGECHIFCGEPKQHLRKLANFIRVESDDNLNEQDSTENKIIKVCCGGYTNLALSSSLEKVYCIPSLVPLGDIKVIEIACGFEHNLLLTDRGDVYTWGAGSRGQLGLATLDDEECPVRVMLPPATHVAAGGWHCVARSADGVLFTWGWNSHGQLGFPTAKSAKGENAVNVAAEPIAVPFPIMDKLLTGLACGTKHTVLVLDHKNVWGCGWNGYGQLGKSASVWPTCEQMTELDVPKGTVRDVFAGGWNTGLLIEQEGGQ